MTTKSFSCVAYIIDTDYTNTMTVVCGHWPDGPMLFVAQVLVNNSISNLIAHFIDKDQKLLKKTLHFTLILEHAGEIIAKSIETCLNNWELKEFLVLL